MVKFFKEFIMLVGILVLFLLQFVPFMLGVCFGWAWYLLYGITLPVLVVALYTWINCD